MRSTRYTIAANRLKWQTYRRYGLIGIFIFEVIRSVVLTLTVINLKFK